MRVLFWSEFFWPYIGGPEILAPKLLRALQARGYEFVVATSQVAHGLPNGTLYQGIPVHRFPFRATLEGISVGQFAETRHEVATLKRRFSPDLVHIFSLGPSVLFHLNTANARAVPSLVTVHTLHYAHSNQPIGRDMLLERILRSANWVTCVSEAVLTHTRRLVPEISPISSRIYSGVAQPDHAPAAFPIGMPRLLCLARLIRDKGLDLALTALASVVQRFPEVRLVIGGDGPARPELERQAAELGLTDVVDFLDWVAPDRIAALLDASTVLVMPSRREGLPLVAVEAALRARPIVAARVGGLPEVVAHRQTGLLVEKEDSKAFAEAITFLLEHPAEAGRMGQEGRLRAQEMFSFGRFVDAFDTLYRRLIEGAPHVASG